MDSNTPFARRVWTHVRSGRLTTTFALLSALSIGILAGSALTGKVHGQQRVDSSDARPLTVPDPVNLSNRFSQIAKQVEPAVVNINTESLPKVGHHRGGTESGGEDDQNDMQDFFNRFFGGGQGQMPQNQPQRALGSGFIVDSRGYILTNDHVVDKADHIYVKLSTDPVDSADPGRPATVVGVDKDTDIAVIKIDTKTPLPTVKLGNSEGAQVGDWVLAIGSPFGLNQTVSAGIVSAKDRSIEESNVSQSQFQRFIQTDAAINPGNSGGPLVDMAGQVIGMNTAIYTQSMGSEGVGFAMPSNTLIRVYNDLIGPEHKVTRGSIGIQFQAMQSSAVGRMYGFSNGGVLISSVTPNGPAAKGGLEAGDAIVSVDGKPIKNGDELVNIISDKHPGSTVRLGYIRNGQQKTAEVGIADRSKLFADIEGGAPAPTPGEGSDVAQAKIGISVDAVPPQMASHMNLRNGGVVITNVKPGSLADEIGLVKGMVITEVNRRAVSCIDSFRSIISGLKSGDDVVFVVHDPRIQNGGGSTYIGGTLP